MEGNGTAGSEWKGWEWIGAERGGLDRIGTEWIGWEWIGVERSGTAGVEWSGAERLERNGCNATHLKNGVYHAEQNEIRVAT